MENLDTISIAAIAISFLSVILSIMSWRQTTRNLEYAARNEATAQKRRLKINPPA